MREGVEVRAVGEESLIQVVLVVDPIPIGPRGAKGADPGQFLPEGLLHLVELVRPVWPVGWPVSEQFGIDHPQGRLIRAVVSVLGGRPEVPIDEIDVRRDEALEEGIGQVRPEREGRLALDAEQRHRVVPRFDPIEPAFVVALDRVLEERRGLSASIPGQSTSRRSLSA